MTPRPLLAPPPRLLAALLAFATVAICAAATAAPAPTACFEERTPPAATSTIDELVFADLATLGVTPARCSDAVFVRRVFLDVLGTLPTAREARDFLRDPDTAHKRRALVERVLQREEFADYWAMRWGDALRIKAEFPVNLWPNAAQAYHRWLRAALAANQPYDRFARELLTASGSNVRVGPVNFYRALQSRTPESIAGAVALAFMGTRIEGWTPERRAGLAAFFSQVGYKPTGEWKEEHVFWDPLGVGATPASVAPGRAAVAEIGTPAKPRDASAVASRAAIRPTEGILPDGTRLALPPDRDPRELFADWLLVPGNPWFARSAVNRVWAWLFGRGIVHEADDFRPDNPPVNAALLAHLEREFVRGGYDFRALLRAILNSATYQMSSLPAAAVDGATVEAHFGRYAPRRLDAEVLIDAINAVTGTSELYTSAIPEPFTYLPEKLPAVAIGDGSITSPFLALFGRSARATGLLAERDDKPVPAQWLHLLNSSHIQRKLEQGPRLRAIVDARRPAAATVEELYLAFLSRFPTPAELRAAEAFVGAGARRREAWTDLAWSLLNSTEFLYRH